MLRTISIWINNIAKNGYDYSYVSEHLSLILLAFIDIDIKFICSYMVIKSLI